MKTPRQSSAGQLLCLLSVLATSTCGDGVVQYGDPSECGPNTTWDGVRCAPDSREEQACTGLPDNAAWNSVSEIDQTWDGESWAPSTVGTHDEEPSSTECRFACLPNYAWNEPHCEPDSRHDQPCTGLPRHASWNTVSTITQTWDGDDWAPTTDGVYDEEPSDVECRFVCDAGYDWDGIRCELPPYFEETWWIGADAHIGSHREGELNALPNLHAAIDDLNYLGLSQKAIMLGDFVHDSPAHLADYEGAMNHLLHSWFDVLGNHDFDRHGTGERVKPRTFFSRTLGGVRFVAVSDDGEWNDGDVVEGYQTEKNLMQDQDDWFRAELDSSPGIPTVLMTHQGLWRYYENPDDDGPCFWDRNRRGWLQDQWDRYNIPLWFRGHNHTWRLNENYRGLGVVDVSPGSTANDTGGGILMTVQQERGNTTIMLHFRRLDGTWISVAGYDEYTMKVVSAIHDWHDLDDVRAHPAGSYVLMNDLDESSPGYLEHNSGSGWRPIGDSSDPFSGSFDGRDHTIRGLFVDGSMVGAGLFGYAEHATISNLGLLDVDVSTTSSNAGALAGRVDDTIVTDCYSTGSVSTRGQYNAGGLLGRAGGRSLASNGWSAAEVFHDWSDGTGSNSGGLIGRLGEDSEVRGSFATGRVEGNSNAGGLVGRSGGTDEGTLISDSYARGDVFGSGSRIGGLVGRNYGPIYNSYSAGAPAGNDPVGGLVGVNEGEASVEGCFWDTEASGISTSAAGTGLTSAEMLDEAGFDDAGWDLGETWSLDASVNDGYPFLPATRQIVVAIYDWHDLDAVRDRLSWHYVLLADLDENSPGYDEHVSSTGWEPIGTAGLEFTGTFDGMSRTIRGLGGYTEAEAGLFGATRSARITYLGLVDADFATTADNAGALVGIATDTFIRQCYSTGVISSMGRYNVGGLVGRAGGRSTITESWSSADVAHDWSEGTGANAGGLAGRIGESTKVTQAFATGLIIGDSNVGGLIGRSGGDGGSTEISDSYARGHVHGSGTRIGGLVGRNYELIFDSYSTGAVSGEGDVGGLVGVDHAGSLVAGGLWDSEASGLTESAAGTALTTGEMTTAAPFITMGFNFASYWDSLGAVNDGYPHLLRCQPLE